MARPPEPADPVRELMARHRALCEQAVDPLEIAAALEDSGFGPAEAAAYRHADVFSLAEELYARVPRCVGIASEQREPRSLKRLRVTRSRSGAVIATVPSVSRTQLMSSSSRPWTLRVLAALLAVPLIVAKPGVGVAGLAGVGLAEGVAGWLRHAARGHLGSAVTLAEFRAGMRPVLPVAVLLQLAVVLLIGFAALAVLAAPGPGGPLRQAAVGATPVQWGTLAALALLQLLTVTLSRIRPAVAFAALVPAGAGFAVSASPTAGLLACGAVAALLLPYVWALLGRPENCG
ncbi:hypothetical protein [Kitasatospora sp. McL0602]|uniref:hypothetical protein n=1 Tax=Kitasatospora sp. McL0602 TaxID=3439530 RepID=UPI003F88B674